VPASSDSVEEFLALFLADETDEFGLERSFLTSNGRPEKPCRPKQSSQAIGFLRKAVHGPE
jgi:hypothetical protein